MNRQRKVVITTTYNDLGIIVDTKAEELDLSAQLNLQPTCNNLATDAISRQAAIDMLEKAMCEDGFRSETGLIHKTTAYEIIRHLPSAQPEQHWISVSERLPEDIKPVLVTWKNNDPASYYQYIVGNHYIGTAHFKSDKWYWYSSVTEDLLAEYGRCDSEEFDEAIEVIAWMPLPELYKGEG